jgi:CheY-like chemotaxis protein
MVINARDAMRSRGRIVIQTRLLPLAQDVANTADAVVRHYLTLSVKDDGPGMTASVVNRIFEPFFTTKGDGKGTGLGLAQVFGFATTAGGSVEAISAPGEGCEIRMTLRVALAQSENGAASALPATRGAEHKPVVKPSSARILLVEDDAVNRASLAELLTDAGYGVLPVASCFAAIPSLPGYAPDVVITDYAMPGFSGAALARLLKDIQPDLPVLFLTGISNLDAVKAALPPEAIVLQKPTIPGELRRAIEQLLSHKKLE